MSLQQTGGKLLKELELIDISAEMRVFTDRGSAWLYVVLAAGGLIVEIGRGDDSVYYRITDNGRAMQKMIDEGGEI